MSASQATTGNDGRRPARWKWLRILAKVVGLALVLSLLLSLLVSYLAPIEFVYALAAGWVIHAMRVLPDLISKWQFVSLPAVALVLAWLISHRLLRWWLTSRNHPAAEAWTMKQSGVVLTLLFLCSGAAITLSCVAHQMMWLSQTKWFESNLRTEPIKRMHDIRQVMLMLYEFDHEQHRLPYSWNELLDWDEAAHQKQLAQWLLCTEQGPSWLTLTLPGAELMALHPATVLVVSDLVQDHHIVGRADTSVTRITPRQLDAMIAEGKWLLAY